MFTALKAYGRVVAAFTAFMLLASCSSPGGPAYTALSESITRPAPGTAQLVFYYPASYFWSGTTAVITVAGKSVCGLKEGGFTLRNVTPGMHTPIDVSLCSHNGTARLLLNTVAGQKYFIRIVPNDETVTGDIGRYKLSEPPKGWIHGNGVFWLDIVDEPTAIKEMQGLTLCLQCS